MKYIRTTNFEILIGPSFSLKSKFRRVCHTCEEFVRIFHMCDKYVRILHTCDRFVRKFVDRPEFGLVLAQLDIEIISLP